MHPTGEEAKVNKQVNLKTEVETVNRKCQGSIPWGARPKLDIECGKRGRKKKKKKAPSCLRDSCTCVTLSLSLSRWVEEEDVGGSENVKKT